jgi:hypothetical protein
MDATRPSRAPVLSLTILDEDTLDDGVLTSTSNVLVVARHPDTNHTHPDVVSVPTQRLPGALLADVVASARSLGPGVDGATTLYAGGVVDSAENSGHHPVIFATESLLARKLGLADALERGTFRFRAALRAVVAGTAVYDNFDGPDVYEPIDMLNVVVALPRAVVPVHVPSYRLAAWATVGSFVAGVDARDPSLIAPQLDPIQLCVHGVCLSAARASIETLIGRVPLDSSEPPVVASAPILHPLG